MLTELTTVKARLGLDLVATTYDELLTRAIQAVSARFDEETNRTLARAQNAIYEFAEGQLDIAVPCYPIESVLKFESKLSEATGWVELPGVDYVIRRHCVISLAGPLSNLGGSNSQDGALLRVTYTGGYLFPGDPDVPGATRLPTDLEHAAIEQTAFWFQTRDKVGVIRTWPRGGEYLQYADTDLLVPVREVLKKHTRWCL